jgi:ankyrin repeat protein
MMNGVTTLDRAGRSPLHYAAPENDVDEALARLDAGDDPNLPDEKGLTPLHFAAQEGALSKSRSYSSTAASELTR